MKNHRPTREEALLLFKKHNDSESLYKHALAVEAVMRHFAHLEGADEEMWGIIGLIHDLDWEKHPDRHCYVTEQILRQEQWPSDWIRAILSHAWGTFTEIEPKTRLEKTLFAIDELTGLVTTTTLVHPSKNIHEVKARSVRKKWKDKRFAAGVDRSIIEKGALMLEMDLNLLIEETIKGMQTIAPNLGLDGNEKNKIK